MASLNPTPDLPADKVTGNVLSAADVNKLKSALATIWAALGGVDDGTASTVASRLDAAATLEDLAAAAIDASGFISDVYPTKTEVGGTYVDAVKPEAWAHLVVVDEDPGVEDDWTAAIAAAFATGKPVLLSAAKTYRVTSLPEFAPGQRLGGQGWDEAQTVLLLDCIGPAITQTTTAPRVQIDNLCIKGKTYAAAFLKGSAALLFMRLNNVNYLNLHYFIDWDSWLSYWFQCVGVRGRDSFRGFIQPEGALEMTWAACDFHNTEALYELTYSALAGGSFAVGDTVTGGTSGEATTVRGVIEQTGSTGLLIVSHEKGTNAAPLTLGFTAAEQLTNVAGVTATYESKRSARSIVLGEGAGPDRFGVEGVSFLGCNHNVNGVEIHNGRNVVLSGGYWESYTADIPTMTMVNTVFHSTAGLLPGSFHSIDDLSYRESAGMAKPDGRTQIPRPFLHDWDERFPLPSCDSEPAVAGFGYTSATASIVDGHLQITGSIVNTSRADFTMPANAEEISVLVRIRNVVGTTIVQLNNSNHNGFIPVTGTDWQVIRLTAIKSGGTLQLRLKAGTLDGGTWTCDVDIVNIAGREGIIGRPKTGHSRRAGRLYGTAAPTSGTWLAGDVIFDRNPTAGGFIGRVCVTGGTPGTWKTFGAISA